MLVIGGSGYIGGAVTNELLARGVPFSVYDNLTYEHQYLKPVDFIYGDIRDYKRLEEFLPNFSHAVYLAGIVGDPACALRPEITKEVNLHSVEWFAKNFDGRIVFPSSCSVYGANDLPVNEQAAINPLSLYAQIKHESESFFKDKNAIIFRVGTAYGVSDNFSRIRMDLAVNYMTMSALLRGFLEVNGGAQWRPFIHVRDIARAMADALDAGKTGIYNLATENASIMEVAEKIKAITNCEIRSTDKKFQDNRNYKADCAKAIKDGILPEMKENNIYFGIEQIKKVVKEKRVTNPEADFYSNVKKLSSIMDIYKNLHKN